MDSGSPMRRPMHLGIYAIPCNFIWKVNLERGAFIKWGKDLNVENRMIPRPG